MGAATVMMAAGDARLPPQRRRRDPIADTVPWSRSLRIMHRGDVPFAALVGRAAGQSGQSCV